MPARPRWSNCYRLPEDLHKAVEAGRLYAHRQPGALMLLEEWPDVFQVCALVYDVAAPCEAPCVAKPLLAECITRGGPVEPGLCGLLGRAGHAASRHASHAGKHSSRRGFAAGALPGAGSGRGAP